MKIVVAPDSFKGALRAGRVAASFAAGWREVRPQDTVIEFPLSDGGEGVCDALAGNGRGTVEQISVHDPLMREVMADIGFTEDFAVLESAGANGIELLDSDELDPMLATTYGVGEALKELLTVRSCRKIIIGIGGSATNDAGTGMLQALGFRFYDARNQEITDCRGGRLHDIAQIDDTLVPEAVRQSSFTIACDVDTPFCGPEGAAPVFAPQKGANPDMVARLDAGMASFAQVIEDKYNINIVPLPGAGAAGGMGGGFRAFLNATLQRGIDMVLDAIGFDQLIQGADLIITGEGKIDFQTAKGKTAAGVLARAKKQGIPVIAIGGCVEMCDSLQQMGFAGIYPITEEKLPLEIAMQSDIAAANVEKTVRSKVEGI